MKICEEDITLILIIAVILVIGSIILIGIYITESYYSNLSPYKTCLNHCKSDLTNDNTLTLACINSCNEGEKK